MRQVRAGSRSEEVDARRPASYDDFMKEIRLHDLEAHLAERLREVREDRETLTVLDGGEPVAHIVPYDQLRDDLEIRDPHPDAPALCDVALPPPLEIDGDVVDLLLLERQNER